MKKGEIKEAEELYKDGHTFYAIAYQLHQWFSKKYTVSAIKKALGGVEDNPIGRQSTKRKGK